MATAVIMPRQGQSVESCIITQWFKKQGDPVSTGDLLFSYETDKASFEVEAAADGILLNILYKEGDEVPVLGTVAFIGSKDEKVDVNTAQGRVGIQQSAVSGLPDVAKAKAGQQPTESIQHPISSSTLFVESTTTHRKTRISPRARRMALNLGIGVEALSGSGPNGRIIVRDIESITAGISSSSTIPAQAHIQGPEFEDKKLSNVRKLIANAMHASLQNSAQLTHHMSADVRKLLEYRKQVKSLMESGKLHINITLNDMVSYCVIRALKRFPEANSHLLGESIRSYNHVHLGIAVDTPRGLMVPSVRQADSLSLAQLSKNLKDVADACRSGSIDPEIIKPTAASFTISNLGNYGVEMFTPVINLPQVAILGVCTIISRPADLGNGVFGFVPYMGLSLTYDHRAIDGGPATLFLAAIKEEIENFSIALV